MHYFVTGSAGSIGRRLANERLQAQRPVAQGGVPQRPATAMPLQQMLREVQP